MWYATCSDTLASSYCCQATSTTGKAASAAEERKACKYVMFSASSSGTFGPKNLMKELGRRIMVETRDERLQSFVSASVQRGNAAASLGTCLHTS